jgi:hypothetical protein
MRRTVLFGCAMRGLFRLAKPEAKLVTHKLANRAPRAKKPLNSQKAYKQLTASEIGSLFVVANWCH